MTTSLTVSPVSSLAYSASFRKITADTDSGVWTRPWNSRSQFVPISRLIRETTESG